MANAAINQPSPNGAVDGLQQLPVGSFNKKEFGMGISVACGFIYWGWVNGIHTYWIHRNHNIDSWHLA